MFISQYITIFYKIDYGNLDMMIEVEYVYLMDKKSLEIKYIQVLH